MIWLDFHLTMGISWKNITFRGMSHMGYFWYSHRLPPTELLMHKTSGFISIPHLILEIKFLNGNSQRTFRVISWTPIWCSSCVRTGCSWLYYTSFISLVYNILLFLYLYYLKKFCIDLSVIRLKSLCDVRFYPQEKDCLLTFFFKCASAEQIWI